MTHESWCDIAGYHGGLDGDCTTSAERIKEGTCVFPVRPCHHSSSEIFLDWSFTCFDTISSLVEWVTRDIEEYMCDIVDDEDEYMYFNTTRGIRSIHRPIDCLLCDRLYRRYTREDRARRRCFDDDTFTTSEMFVPVYITTEVKESIEVNDPCFAEREVYSIGKSTPYEEFVEILIASATLHETVLRTDI